MLGELLADSRRLTGFLRLAHEICGRYKDLASTSMIEVWIDQTERRTWFLAEIGHRRWLWKSDAGVVPSRGAPANSRYMSSSVSSVVPPLRIDCLKDRIACPICEPARSLDVLHDAAIHSLRPDHEFHLHFPGGFFLGPGLRRLVVTQVDIWTRQAREVAETQARFI